MAVLPRTSLARSGLLGLALLLQAPASASAQLGSAAGGVGAGLVGGAVVSMGVITLRARAGHYLFGADPFHWEVLPVPLAMVAGGVLGYQDPDRLRRAAGWGGGGMALGALGGALAGRLFWEGDEGPWAGALVGGAMGFLAGAVAGGLSWEDGGAAPLSAGLRLPVGP